MIIIARPNSTKFLSGLVIELNYKTVGIFIGNYNGDLNREHLNRGSIGIANIYLFVNEVQ